MRQTAAREDALDGPGWRSFRQRARCMKMDSSFRWNEGIKRDDATTRVPVFAGMTDVSPQPCPIGSRNTA